MSKWILALALVAGIAAAETATLTWVAPTQNEDGSPLTDLDGYRIRYGCTQPGAYTETVELEDEAALSHVVEDLPSPATCYFVIFSRELGWHRKPLLQRGEQDVRAAAESAVHAHGAGRAHGLHHRAVRRPRCSCGRGECTARRAVRLGA